MTNLALRDVTLTANSNLPGGQPFESTRKVCVRGSIPELRADLLDSASGLPWPPKAMRRTFKAEFHIVLEVDVVLLGNPKHQIEAAVDHALEEFRVYLK